MPVLACDVDLRRVHAFSDQLGRVCYRSADWPWDAIRTHDTILIEVADATDTSKNSAQQYNRRRWMVGNSFELGKFYQWMVSTSLQSRVLVSPATKWTCGHKQTVRELVSGCQGEDNHDIRACRCMIFYFARNPHHWTDIREYYATF
jgi:hypothetical protein